MFRQAPPGKKESSFPRGDLKYIVLDLLKEKSRYGYEIIMAIDERSSGLYKPSPGVIYPTLQMLEEMEYARSEENDGKKVYSITGAGLRFLTERKREADEVRSKIKHRWSFRNMGRLAMLMKEYRQLEQLLRNSCRLLDEDRTQRIRDILSRTYEEIETIVQE
ncbi:MAG: PadR family transcriptional regulator [Chloroflexi bacterium]|nr:PadR family transcriptional regulator [Chloroflexota bacterium]